MKIKKTCGKCLPGNHFEVSHDPQITKIVIQGTGNSLWYTTCPMGHKPVIGFRRDATSKLTDIGAEFHGNIVDEAPVTSNSEVHIMCERCKTSFVANEAKTTIEKRDKGRSEWATWCDESHPVVFVASAIWTSKYAGPDKAYHECWLEEPVS